MGSSDRSGDARTPARTRSRRGHDPPHGGVPAGVTWLMVACCAGPALIAAGTVAVIGIVLGNVWAIAASGLLVGFAAINVVRRAGFARALTRMWPPGPSDRGR